MELEFKSYNEIIEKAKSEVREKDGKPLQAEHGKTGKS